MNQEKNKKLDALIFIDTNIYLDFYRIRKANVSMNYLQEIDKHKALIITGSQVEMEFKNHRQDAILESISGVNKNITINLSVPAILSDVKDVEMIRKSKKGIEEHQKRLKQRIERILKNPNCDPVYKSLQKLFKFNSSINLNREKKNRYAIRKLALKRFLLGYPPKKKSDNSIGDAVNWEWILDCAKNTGKHIIIVTRDSDYGTKYNEDYYLNDWLSQEFKQRISQKRKLFITDKLGVAFKLVNIQVTKEMIEEEEKVIGESSLNYALRTTQDSIRLMKETINLDELQKTQNYWRNLGKMYGSYIKNLQFPSKNLNLSDEKVEN